MYYGATGIDESVQTHDTALPWIPATLPPRHEHPLEDDIDDPSDEPWSVASRRRRSTVPARQHRGVAHDGPGPCGKKHGRIELVLYTSAASENCQRALRAVLDVLRDYDPDQVKFTVHDLSGNPEAGDEDAVIFTPTLVKRGPGARTYMVGDLERPDLLTDLLDVNGVRRLRGRQ
jgi:hypothetical protein